MTVLNIILICLLACCLIMVLVWFWAYKIKNAGVVDIFWSYNFPVITLILYLTAGGFETRKLLICSMVFIAGMRLGTYLLIRVTKHLNEEEDRYKKIREEWAPKSDRKFFWFFQMQAASNVFLAIPFFIITDNTKPQLTLIEYIGTAIWVIGFLGESIADAQLKKFKNSAESKRKVCNIGLWKYSRHPNYFFEWIMWLAYFIFALGSPYGYLSIISPLVILYLILKVTGIPLNEEQAIRSKGLLYKEYQKTTSAFFPWFKKKNADAYYLR